MSHFSLMDVMSLGGLEMVTLEQYGAPPRISRLALEHVLSLVRGFWCFDYEGDPTRPHALLSAGGHSDGFINLGDLLKDYKGVRKVLASNLLWILKNRWEGKVDWVVGSDTSATALAGSMVELLGAKHAKMVKTEDERGKRQVWDPANGQIGEDEVVLHIEELTTTGATPLAVRRGVRLGNPDLVPEQWVPYLPIVVDRAPEQISCIEGSVVLPLFRYDIKTWTPEECQEHGPCKEGSPAIRPREGNNWARLSGKAA